MSNDRYVTTVKRRNGYNRSETEKDYMYMFDTDLDGAESALLMALKAVKTMREMLDMEKKNEHYEVSALEIVTAYNNTAFALKRLGEMNNELQDFTKELEEQGLKLNECED